MASSLVVSSFYRERWLGKIFVFFFTFAYWYILHLKSLIFTSHRETIARNSKSRIQKNQRINFRETKVYGKSKRRATGPTIRFTALSSIIPRGKSYTPSGILTLTLFSQNQVYEPAFVKRIGSCLIPHGYKITPETRVKLEFRPLFRTRNWRNGKFHKPWAPVSTDNDNHTFPDFCDLVSCESKVVKGRDQVDFSFRSLPYKSNGHY